jgi:hypothetical protein
MLIDLFFLFNKVNLFNFKFIIFLNNNIKFLFIKINKLILFKYILNIIKLIYI